MSSNLVAILHSLPVGAGARTLSRVDVVRRVLGLDTYSVPRRERCAADDGRAGDNDGVSSRGR